MDQRGLASEPRVHGELRRALARRRDLVGRRARDSSAAARFDRLLSVEDLQDLVGAALELDRADAWDVGQIGRVFGTSLGDLGERFVVEHDVGGHTVGLGSLPTPVLQPLPDRTIGGRGSI